jgi:hypothetical protein
MRRNPLKVEVDDGPEDVGYPRPIVLFRFYQPIRVFEKVRDAEGWTICPFAQTKAEACSKKTQNFTHLRPVNRCEPWDR